VIILLFTLAICNARERVTEYTFGINHVQNIFIIVKRKKEGQQTQTN